MVRLSVVLCLIACHGDHAAPPPPQPTALSCSNSGGHGDGASVATTATAFRAALTDAQRTLLDQPMTRASAIKWSNLPVGIVPRQGVRLGDLDATQSASVRTMLAAATSACGLTMIDELRLADSSIKDLDVDHRFAWGAENYFVAFLGSPSERAPWMLQFSGHHFSLNLVFNGRQVSATPLFFGAEPVHFKTPDGKDHEPLQQQSAAMAALATALAAHPEAHLAGTFTDVVRGVVIIREPGKPMGGYDTGFPIEYPSADRGMRYATLSPDEQRHVRDALESYASLPGDAISHALVAAYEDPAALAETFVGTTGGADLAKTGLYVRIDGPRIWMEFIVQDGVAYPAIPHYHALWRDKLADYGGEIGR